MVNKILSFIFLQNRRLSYKSKEPYNVASKHSNNFMHFI